MYYQEKNEKNICTNICFSVSTSAFKHTLTQKYIDQIGILMNKWMNNTLAFKFCIFIIIKWHILNTHPSKIEHKQCNRFIWIIYSAKIISLIINEVFTKKKSCLENKNLLYNFFSFYTKHLRIQIRQHLYFRTIINWIAWSLS